jgi:hypothetical protein
MDIELIAEEIIEACEMNTDLTNVVLKILEDNIPIVKEVYLACSSSKWGENIKVFYSPTDALWFYKEYYEDSDNFKLSDDLRSIVDGYISVVDIMKVTIQE